MLPLVRFTAGAYWAVLTLLLLVPNPRALLGLDAISTPGGGRGVHLVLFLGLTLLMVASRWPIPLVVLATILIVHGTTTELLQHLIPPRTVETLDFIENIAGVLLGMALGWGARRWTSRASELSACAGSDGLASSTREGRHGASGSPMSDEQSGCIGLCDQREVSCDVDDDQQVSPES